MIKAVVFDIDDTLYPEQAFRESAFAYIAAHETRAGFALSAEDITEIYRIHPKDCFDVLVRTHHLPHTPHELIDIFRSHPPRIEPFPEVVEVLQELQKKYALGIITDYYAATQKNKLHALGLEKYFSQVIYTEELGAPKPSIEPFARMKTLLGCRAGEIVYVSDNEQKDFIGARQAGYVTVRFTRDGGVYSHLQSAPEYRADHEISDHRALLVLLETLNKNIDE